MEALWIQIGIGILVGHILVTLFNFVIGIFSGRRNP